MSNVMYPSLSSKEIPLPSPPINHETRWVTQRADEWALTVTTFEVGTPHDLVDRYRRAFHELTEAGRAIAQYQDELDAKAQQ